MITNLKIDKKLVFQRVSFFSSISGLILGCVSFYLLGLNSLLPIVMISYSILNFFFLLWFYKHNNVERAYMQCIILAFGFVIAVNVLSGGVAGPFNVFIPVAIISGYIVQRNFGRYCLAISLIYFMIVFSLDGDLINALNEIPPEHRPLFFFLAFFMGIINVGVINGEYLVSLIDEEKLKVEEILLHSKQKETYRNETHSRVEGNMRIISDLLSFQSSFIEDPKIKEYFKLSKKRIDSMVVVHEMLYKQSDFSRIDCHDYLKRLVYQSVISLKGHKNNININLDIPHVFLNIETAIPRGILINEIIGISLTNGIPDEQRGTLSIQLVALESPYYFLRIRDDGNVSINAHSEILELDLLQGLARKLNGAVGFDETTNGTHFRMKFQVIPNNSRREQTKLSA